MPSKLVIGTASPSWPSQRAGCGSRQNGAAWHLAFQPQLGAPLFEPPAGGEAHLVWNRRTEKEV